MARAMRRTRWGRTIGAALGMMTLAAEARATGARTTPAPPATPIYGGAEAEICAFPGIVSLDNGDARCTGTLVHPRLVLYAAHCGAGDMKVGFGQSAAAPDHVVTPELCVVNPDYLGTDDEAHDWAFCRLAEPAPVPVVPIAFGCEQDLVQSKSLATIVGYGQTSDGAGDGPKRWAEAPIRLKLADYVEVGGLGEPAGCAGDSGGPALIKAADGTWRVFGVASVHVAACGGIGHYAYAWDAVPWVEQTSGLDLTPCHDPDGTWHPDFRCGAFAPADSAGAGTWADQCAAAPRGPASASCGDPFDVAPDTTPPTVSITSPTGEPLPGPTAKVAIEVAAEDIGWGVARVSLEIDGALQGTDEDPPFGFGEASFPAGTYTLVAIAEDAAGHQTRSEAVTLEVGEDAATGGPDPKEDGCGCTSGAPAPAWAWLALGTWWIRPGRRRR